MKFSRFDRLKFENRKVHRFGFFIKHEIYRIEEIGYSIRASQYA